MEVRVLLFALLACRQPLVIVIEDGRPPSENGQVDDTEGDSPVESPAPVDGASLFAEHCAACHGDDGRGGPSGPDLQREMNHSDEQLVGVILSGKGKMPAIEVTDEEAQAIVDYLRSFLQ